MDLNIYILWCVVILDLKFLFLDSSKTIFSLLKVLIVWLYQDRKNTRKNLSLFYPALCASALHHSSECRSYSPIMRLITMIRERSMKAQTNSQIYKNMGVALQLSQWTIHTAGKRKPTETVTLVIRSIRKKTLLNLVHRWTDVVHCCLNSPFFWVHCNYLLYPLSQIYK